MATPPKEIAVAVDSNRPPQFDTGACRSKHGCACACSGDRRQDDGSQLVANYLARRTGSFRLEDGGSVNGEEGLDDKKIEVADLGAASVRVIRLALGKHQRCTCDVPVQSSSPSLRLVKVDGEKIDVKFVHEGSNGGLPSYEALSYGWGDTEARAADQVYRIALLGFAGTDESQPGRNEPLSSAYDEYILSARRPPRAVQTRTVSRQRPVDKDTMGGEPPILKLGTHLPKYPSSGHRRRHWPDRWRPGTWTMKAALALSSPIMMISIQNYAKTNGLTPNLPWNVSIVPGGGGGYNWAETALSGPLLDLISDPSPVTFLWLCVGTALAMRAYAHLNSCDRYQPWFVAMGLICWPGIGIALGLDLLAGSFCVMPWAVFLGLLLSDAVHSLARTLGRPNMTILRCQRDQGDEKALGSEVAGSWRDEKTMAV
ncbi:hypothetical protein LTR10_008089 [Elasticomyces elasticus]|nr:hypothetical protein LTR10_008089 [Elasticomyces elasticus]KAK4971087.1 hypothetical protein LTR42_008066 [Elasticomyces elasticus]